MVFALRHPPTTITTDCPCQDVEGEKGGKKEARNVKLGGEERRREIVREVGEVGRVGGGRKGCAHFYKTRHIQTCSGTKGPMPQWFI